jgi:uncharacterized protein (TIGR02996 family)
MAGRKKNESSPATRPELLSLLRTCKANPDDTTARLVLADWLEEYGDQADHDWAEAIRLQMAPQTPEGKCRVAQILASHKDSWFGRLVKARHTCEFRRGLLWLRLQVTNAVAVTLLKLAPTETFARVAELAIDGVPTSALELIAGMDGLAELQSLTIHSPSSDEVAEVLARSPNFARLRELRLTSRKMTDRGLAALAGSHHLRLLADLNISNSRVTAEGLRQFAKAPFRSALSSLCLFACEQLGDLKQAIPALSGLPALASLDIDHCGIGPAGAAALADTGGFGNLSKLSLKFNNLGPAGVTALAATRGFPALRDLDLGYNNIGDGGMRALAGSDLLGRLTAIQLGTNQGITLAGFRALVHSPRVANLEVFWFTCNYLGDASAEILATSPYLGKLRHLQLESNRLTAAGVAALTRAPWMQNIETLELQSNAIGDAGVRALAGCPAVANLRHLSLWSSSLGITDAGAVALAGSPYLRNLERLGLDLNPITDTGALALLHSPHLVRLTRASLSHEQLSPAVVEQWKARFADEFGV